MYRDIFSFCLFQTNVQAYSAFHFVRVSLGKLHA